MTYVAPVELARQSKELCEEVADVRNTAAAAFLACDAGLASLVTAVGLLAQAVELLAEKERTP